MGLPGELRVAFPNFPGPHTRRPSATQLCVSDRLRERNNMRVPSDASLRNQRHSNKPRFETPEHHESLFVPVTLDTETSPFNHERADVASNFVDANHGQRPVSPGPVGESDWRPEGGNRSSLSGLIAPRRRDHWANGLTLVSTSSISTFQTGLPSPPEQKTSSWAIKVWPPISQWIERSVASIRSICRLIGACCFFLP